MAPPFLPYSKKVLIPMKLDRFGQRREGRDEGEQVRVCAWVYVPSLTGSCSKMPVNVWNFLSSITVGSTALKHKLLVMHIKQSADLEFCLISSISFPQYRSRETKYQIRGNPMAPDGPHWFILPSFGFHHGDCQRIAWYAALFSQSLWGNLPQKL